MSDRVRVLIADDHPPTRAGIRAALEDAGWEVCAEHSDASSALEAALRERPDVCLLDVHMPGNGIAAAAAIADEMPETVIVMLTVSRADSDLFDALRAGAAGYLLKDTPPAKLATALQSVLAGEAALPRTLVARLIEEFRSREGRRVPLLRGRNIRLTDREWEVLDCLSDGMSTRAIAERLFISEGTVRSHASAIFAKLEVKSREEAVRLLRETSRPTPRPAPG